MNIIVLTKHAPDPESEIRIGEDGKSVDQRGLVYDINDWDRYAVEEAIQIKERFGDGEVVVVGVGSACEDTLRKCLAMGADRAIKIPQDATMDAFQTADLIKNAIKDEKFDIIMAGYQSQDLNNALVGTLLAGMLEIPFATAVTALEVENSSVKVRRELEGGYNEEVILPTPCLVTIQSGINEPRYVSIMGIKRAKTKELKEVEVRSDVSTLEVEKMYFPPVKKAEMLEGSPEEVAKKLIELLKDRGLI
jgi:electron transfer flavoprotein beta subunit